MEAVQVCPDYFLMPLVNIHRFYLSQVDNSNGNALERVDSGATDDSPFGSSLTTPVDEDIQLFHGIEQRLLVKGEIETLATSWSAIYIGERDRLDASIQSRHFSNAAAKSQEFAKGLLENSKVRDFVVCERADV